MNDTEAEIALLRAELESLKARVGRTEEEQGGQGFGLGFGLPIVPIGGGGETTPGPFEPVYTNGVLSGLKNCIFCAERQFVSMQDQTITGVTKNTDGYVVLTINHPSTAADAGFSTGTVSVDTSGFLPSNTDDTVTKIPLYHITKGVVDIDLRAVPTAVLAK